MHEIVTSLTDFRSIKGIIDYTIVIYYLLACHTKN